MSTSGENEEYLDPSLFKSSETEDSYDPTACTSAEIEFDDTTTMLVEIEDCHELTDIAAGIEERNDAAATAEDSTDPVAAISAGIEFHDPAISISVEIEDCYEPTAAEIEEGNDPSTCASAGAEDGVDFKWTSHSTKRLIDLYKKYIRQRDCNQIRNRRQMWQKIAEELEAELDTKVTARTCGNRWKVLDRNYKKHISSQTSTGTEGHCFEFANDMEKLYGKKKPVEPILLLSSDTIHIPVDTSTTIDENGEIIKKVKKPKKRKKVNNKLRERRLKRKKEKDEKYEEELRRILEEPVSPVPSQSVIEEKVVVLDNMRSDRKEYQDKQLKLEMERLEVLRSRNELLQERNEIMQEKNRLFRERLRHKRNTYFST